MELCCVCMQEPHGKMHILVTKEKVEFLCCHDCLQEIVLLAVFNPDKKHEIIELIKMARKNYLKKAVKELREMEKRFKE